MGERGWFVAWFIHPNNANMIWEKTWKKRHNERRRTKEAKSVHVSLSLTQYIYRIHSDNNPHHNHDILHANTQIKRKLLIKIVHPTQQLTDREGEGRERVRRTKEVNRDKKARRRDSMGWGWPKKRAKKIAKYGERESENERRWEKKENKSSKN